MLWRIILTSLAVMLLASGVEAQEELQLIRDEVAVIKKKLVSTLDALGQPPTGYAQERESFNLPTEAYKAETPRMVRPVQASANRRFGVGTGTQKQLEMEYGTKMLEAQRKGDMQQMMKLGQENGGEKEGDPTGADRGHGPVQLQHQSDHRP